MGCRATLRLPQFHLGALQTVLQGLALLARLLGGEACLIPLFGQCHALRLGRAALFTCFGQGLLRDRQGLLHPVQLTLGCP